MEDFSESNASEYGRNYSESGLWNKLKGYAKKAGETVVYDALLLFYVLKSSEVPFEKKAIIIGALGYFILPVDVIPDAVPMLGFTDDLAALKLALNAVRSSITPAIERQAQNKLREYFG